MKAPRGGRSDRVGMALHAQASVALVATLVLWGSLAPAAPLADRTAPGVSVADKTSSAGPPADATHEAAGPVADAAQESAGPVADAAQEGDVSRVRALLRDGADVNAAQGDGMTALHWAAEKGNADLANILLTAGANPAAVTRLGDYTPLHIASRHGDADVVTALLGAGADPGARTSPAGLRPLHYAAASGSVATVDALVDHGAQVDAREPRWLQTPLMFAANEGRTDVVRALVAAGADPALTARVMDMARREQQDDADQDRQEEVREALLAAREGRLDAPAEDERDGGGYPVSAATTAPAPAERPDGPASQEPDSMLSRSEINDQQRDRVPSSRYSHAELVGGYGGLAPLHLAAREGHVETAIALLDLGTDIDQPSEGDHSTPLLIATINGHFDLALRLFEAGADPTIASDANATPLYTTLNTRWIPKSRHPQPADYLQQQVTYLELMKVFLDAGVDPNVRLSKQLWFTTFGDDYLRVDRMGATPFWRAAYALDLEAMRLLVEYGADPHVPTMKTVGRRYGDDAPGGPDPSGLPPVPPGGPGAYPIHAASGVGYGEGYAANIHRVVPDGWLPAVRYLVEELGADVNARDDNGYTAVHHAAARGDNELILYLVEKGADVTVVSREGQTTVDMANGPVQRISPFPATIELLESLGATNNHNCVSC